MSMVCLHKTWRFLSVVLTLALTLQTILPAALATARLAERIELAALGLADIVDSHSGGSQGASKTKWPGQRAPHESTCECCLSGCGGAGQAGLPSDKGALARPLLAANSATRVAQKAARLRSYLSERTTSPRSPPSPA